MATKIYIMRRYVYEEEIKDTKGAIRIRISVYLSLRLFYVFDEINALLH